MGGEGRRDRGTTAVLISGGRLLILYLVCRGLQRRPRPESEEHESGAGGTFRGRDPLASDQQPSTRCRDRNVDFGRRRSRIDHRRRVNEYVAWVW